MQNAMSLFSFRKTGNVSLVTNKKSNECSSLPPIRTLGTLSQNTESIKQIKTGIERNKSSLEKDSLVSQKLPSISSITKILLLWKLLEEYIDVTMRR